MILLILGVALWSGAHLFKRVTPDARAQMGNKGKGLVALLTVASIVMMVIGYRMADGPVWWGRGPILVGINNLLMVVAFYLFAASGTKAWVGTKTRNLQLNGLKTWAMAHMIVNGDLASWLLFGGLTAWAVVQMIYINRSGEPWDKPTEFTVANEVKTLVIALVMMAVVMGIHYSLGYQPWG